MQKFKQEYIIFKDLYILLFIEKAENPKFTTGKKWWWWIMVFNKILDPVVWMLHGCSAFILLKWQSIAFIFQMKSNYEMPLDVINLHVMVWHDVFCTDSSFMTTRRN